MIQSPNADHLFNRGLKISHIRLLSALVDSGQLSKAADRIGVTQPAASRLLAEIEQIVGQPVHQRTGRGMALTVVGKTLAIRAQRIQLELRDAARDLVEVSAGVAGHVRIGSVTGPAIDRVLPVLRSARLTAPQITAEVIVAPSDILCGHLLAGRIDFAVGRLPEGPERTLFSLAPIATEPVALVVRRGHPLTNLANPQLADLLNYDWVMPPPDSILTRAVHARLSTHNMPRPPQRLATASFLLIFALLQQSNAIAPLARTVATIFSETPDSPYVELAIDLGIEVETFGLVTLAGSILTPVASRMATEMRTIEPH